MTQIITRRSILTGLVGLIAAPAVVKASSLMPVKPTKLIWTSHGIRTFEIRRATLNPISPVLDPQWTIERAVDLEHEIDSGALRILKKRLEKELDRRLLDSYSQEARSDR